MEEILAYGIALPDGSAATVPLSGRGSGGGSPRRARHGGRPQDWSGRRQGNEECEQTPESRVPGSGANGPAVSGYWDRAA